MSDEPGWEGPLPEPVRLRVVALASDTLGSLSDDEVEQAVRDLVTAADDEKRHRFGAATVVRLTADDDLAWTLAWRSAFPPVRLPEFLFGVVMAAALGCLGVGAAAAAGATQAIPATVTGSTSWSVASTLPPVGAPATFTYGVRPLVPIMGDWDGDGDRPPGTFEAAVRNDREVWFRRA